MKKSLKFKLRKPTQSEGKTVSCIEFWRLYDLVWRSGPPTRLENPDNIKDPT